MPRHPNRVREVRLAKYEECSKVAFSIKWVAAMCGVDPKSLYAWEEGESPPHHRNAKRLAAVLGVTVEELGLG